MSKKFLKELDADGLRSVFLKYTRKAFEIIPELDNPYILDIGCGTGIPTIELTRLSNGQITGIDIDQDVLDKLEIKVKEMGLLNRVKVYNRSIYDTKFEDTTFDIILEEGTLHLLDLKKALTECSRILKMKGYLITGKAIRWAGRKLKHFPRFDFELIHQIPWQKECWWREYYKPLEERINNLQKKYGDLGGIDEIQQHKMEIGMVKKDPAAFDCITYIFQKVN
ncbi:MAG: class I SAM-dependent methyltransferase [Promethearchaeota archaeon]|jgi:SAM-dependent methyltransferase